MTITFPRCRHCFDVRLPREDKGEATEPVTKNIRLRHRVPKYLAIQVALTGIDLLTIKPRSELSSFLRGVPPKMRRRVCRSERALFVTSF